MDIPDLSGADVIALNNMGADMINAIAAVRRTGADGKVWVAPEAVSALALEKHQALQR